MLIHTKVRVLLIGSKTRKGTQRSEVDSYRLEIISRIDEIGKRGKPVEEPAESQAAAVSTVGEEGEAGGEVTEALDGGRYMEEGVARSARAGGL